MKNKQKHLVLEASNVLVFCPSKRGFEFCTACDNFLGFLPRRFEVPWTMKALCHVVDW